MRLPIVRMVKSGLFPLLLLGVFLRSPPEQVGVAYVVAVSAVVLWLVAWLPEVVVAGYLFAGRLGFDERLAGGGAPVSANQLLGGGLLLILLIHRRAALASLRHTSIQALLVFTATICAGMLYTLGPIYGLEKTSRYLVVVVPSVLATAALVQARRSLVPTFGAMWAIGLGLDLLAIFPIFGDPGDEQPFRLSALGGGPNVFSRAVGLMILISFQAALYLFQLPKGTPARRTLLGVFVLALLVGGPGFILAQSRGPTLALVVSLALVVGLYARDVRRLVLSLLILVSAALALDSLVQANRSVNRFDLSRETNRDSFEQRVLLINMTLDSIQDRPLLGTGTGGWPVAIRGIDQREYPHNLFVEVSAEQGLLVAGLLFFILGLLFVRALSRCWSAPDGFPRSMLVVGISSFAFFLLAVQVSGDIVDNRTLWLTLCLMEFAIKAVPAKRSVPANLPRMGPLANLPSLTPGRPQA